MKHTWYWAFLLPWNYSKLRRDHIRFMANLKRKPAGNLRAVPAKMAIVNEAGEETVVAEGLLLNPPSIMDAHAHIDSLSNNLPDLGENMVEEDVEIYHAAHRALDSGDLEPICKLPFDLKLDVFRHWIAMYDPGKGEQVRKCLGVFGACPSPRIAEICQMTRKDAGRHVAYAVHKGNAVLLPAQIAYWQGGEYKVYSTSLTRR